MSFDFDDFNLDGKLTARVERKVDPIDVQTFLNGLTQTTHLERPWVTQFIRNNVMIDLERTPIKFKLDPVATSQLTTFLFGSTRNDLLTVGGFRKALAKCRAKEK